MYSDMSARGRYARSNTRASASSPLWTSSCALDVLLLVRISKSSIARVSSQIGDNITHTRSFHTTSESNQRSIASITRFFDVQREETITHVLKTANGYTFATKKEGERKHLTCTRFFLSMRRNRDRKARCGAMDFSFSKCQTKESSSVYLPFVNARESDLNEFALTLRYSLREVTECVRFGRQPNILHLTLRMRQLGFCDIASVGKCRLRHHPFILHKKPSMESRFDAVVYHLASWFVCAI